MEVTAHKNAVLGALSAIGAFISGQLGGWDAAMKVLMYFMAADYMSGVLVALIWRRSAKTISGGLSSDASFRGLVRKAGILFIVWLAAMLDTVLGGQYVRTAVILFFIANEGISVLENTAVMGVPYPDFLKKALETLKDGGNEYKRN